MESALGLKDTLWESLVTTQATATTFKLVMKTCANAVVESGFKVDDVDKIAVLPPPTTANSESSSKRSSRISSDRPVTLVETKLGSTFSLELRLLESISVTDDAFTPSSDTSNAKKEPRKVNFTCFDPFAPPQIMDPEVSLSSFVGDCGWNDWNDADIDNGMWIADEGTSEFYF